MELRVVLVESEALKHELAAAEHIAFEFQFCVDAHEPKVDFVRHLLQTLG